MSILLKNYVFPPVFVDNRRQFVGQYGVTKSGPIDEYHFAYNCTLLNNSPEATAIECIGHIQIHIIQPVTLAFTGSCAVSVAGNTLKDAVGLFAPDTIIDIYPTEQGFRFYIGCYSGFSADSVFNSCNSVNREGFGPVLHLNDVIHSNQIINISDKNLSTVLDKSSAKPHFLDDLFSQEIFTTSPQIDNDQPTAQNNFQATIENMTLIPFVQNFQHKLFSTAQCYSFLHEIFTVAPESNRMGYRLNKQQILSHPLVLDNSQVTVLGGLQITPAGQTIVLMNDKQTVGGYPMMGTVTALGRARLGQLNAGCKIKFVAQDIHSAYAQQQMLWARLGVIN